MHLVPRLLLLSHAFHVWYESGQRFSLAHLFSTAPSFVVWITTWVHAFGYNEIYNVKGEYPWKAILHLERILQRAILVKADNG